MHENGIQKAHERSTSARTIFRVVQGPSPKTINYDSTFASTLHVFARVCKAGYRTECSCMYRTKGLCWLFLESYVRLSNCHEAINEDCFFNRFCYQVMAKLHLLPDCQHFFGTHDNYGSPHRDAQFGDQVQGWY